MDSYQIYVGLMVRSAAKQRVSNHEATPSFETHRFAMLLRMRRLRTAERDRTRT